MEMQSAPSRLASWRKFFPWRIPLDVELEPASLHQDVPAVRLVDAHEDGDDDGDNDNAEYDDGEQMSASQKTIQRSSGATGHTTAALRHPDPQVTQHLLSRLH
jgi:hypothetical protein